MNRSLFFGLITIALMACSSGGGDDPSSGNPSGNPSGTCSTSATEAAVGCWISETCRELTTSPPISTNISMVFYEDGTMSQHDLFYNNLVCQGDPASNTDPLYPESYDFIADKTMQSGVTARVVDYQQDRGTFVQHRYGVIHIDADRMCFGTGDYTPVLGFNPLSNTVTGAPDTLDFVNCITRVN